MDNKDKINEDRECIDCSTLFPPESDSDVRCFVCEDELLANKRNNGEPLQKM